MEVQISVLDVVDVILFGIVVEIANPMIGRDTRRVVMRHKKSCDEIHEMNAN